MYVIAQIDQNRTPKPYIYDPRDPALRIRYGICTTEVNAPGGLDFVVDYDHPSYDDIAVKAGFVDVLDDAGYLFRGRISHVETDINLAKHVHAEGALAILCDSACPPFTYPDDFLDTASYQAAAASGNVVEHFLSVLLAWHNDIVNPWQQLTVGNVTVTDPNNYISRSREHYGRMWDVVKESLFGSSLGGYMMVRPGTGTDLHLYVDYLAELPEDTEQKIEFSKNLLDILRVDDADELYTAVLPIGKGGLTISALTNGTIEDGIVKYDTIVYNERAGVEHGVVVKVIKYDDITKASNLRARAVAEARLAGIARSVQVKAVDLYASGDGAFRAGRRIPLDSGPYGISASLELTKLETNLLDPSQTAVSFGTALPTISSQTANAI